jgi:hypothetical protein
MPQPPVGDVIDPPGRERPASQDPPRRERGPSQGPVSADRLQRILGARRCEPALPPDPPGQGGPVQQDRADQKGTDRGARHPERTAKSPHGDLTRSTPARASRSSISATTSCVLAPRMASRRATKAMSYPCRTRGASSRQAARKMRRARLRTTAPPTRRPATKATLPKPGPTDTNTRRPSTGFADGSIARDGPVRFVAATYAESRVLPLARRLARMARPARLRMRERNPWVFLRLRLFG